MVYDADTGKFKRMWGAYGNKPLDMDARPPVTPAKPNELCPLMCDDWPALQQFAVPHDVTHLQRRACVYVPDRGNKRVQVFTIDGKFIAEQYFGLDSKYPLQAEAWHFPRTKGFCTSEGPRSSIS